MLWLSDLLIINILIEQRANHEQSRASGLLDIVARGYGVGRILNARVV
jgi:hypothetical protein